MGPYALSPHPSAIPCSGSALSDFQAHEARDAYRATERLVDLRDDVLDRHFRVADRRLVHEDGLGVEAPELALHDLVEDIGRLARVLHLRAVDRLFLLEHVGGYLVARGVRRAGRRD